MNDEQLMKDIAAIAAEKALDSARIAIEALPSHLRLRASLYAMVNLWLHCNQHLIAHGDKQMTEALISITKEISR